MIRNVEVVSCDLCGEDIEGMLVTAKVREYGKVEPRDRTIRLYNQIAFNYGGTRYIYDICSKCRKKVDNGEISISTDMSLNRRFTNG